MRDLSLSPEKGTIYPKERGANSTLPGGKVFPHLLAYALHALH